MPELYLPGKVPLDWDCGESDPPLHFDLSRWSVCPNISFMRWTDVAPAMIIMEADRYHLEGHCHAFVSGVPRHCLGLDAEVLGVIGRWNVRERSFACCHRSERDVLSGIDPFLPAGYLAHFLVELITLDAGADGGCRPDQI